MPNFSSISELEQWLKSSGWIQAKTSSGLTMKDILIQEGEKLKSCLEKAISNYYDTMPSSGIVPRTYDLQNSLLLDKLVHVDLSSGRLSIGINFDADKIKAESIIDGYDSSAYNTAVLINDGWQVEKNVWFKDIERFGFYHDGFDFIQEALNSFYADNPYNLKVHVEGFKKNYD